jgi:hypothetical protein
MKSALVAQKDVLCGEIVGRRMHVASGKAKDTPAERLLWKGASSEYLLKDRDCAVPQECEEV